MVRLIKAFCLGFLLVAAADAGAQTVPVTPRTAQADGELKVLIGLLDIPENIAIMREEGIAYGATLDKDLFSGNGGAAWAEKVAAIYDAEQMERRFLARLQQDVPQNSTTALIEFFGSDLGKRVVRLELTARKALLDSAVEEIANQTRDEMASQKDPRLDAVRAFIVANDLVEQNVVGAMNANFAFYRGMAEGGSFDKRMSETEILADVWSQEADIRGQTTDWLTAYLGLAYQPLSDADLAAYIAFSGQPDAQVLNTAMFAAFNEMFSGISHDLGVAAAGILGQKEL